MSQRHDSDALVAGAGPVGLFAALTLAKRGLNVRIVDDAWRETSRSYALALHPATLGLLAEEGLADALVARAQRVDTVAFYEGEKRVLEVPFGGLGGRYPFVAVLPQHDFETLMADELHKRGVDVGWSQRVSSIVPEGDRLAVEVQRLGKSSSGYAVAHTEWVVDAATTAYPQHVVGADGHNSLVRRRLGIEFEPAGEPLLYAVFELAGVGVPSHEVRVVLGEGTTDVLWPLPGNRFRWSFQLADDRQLRLWREKSRLAVNLGPGAFPHLGGEALAALLRERAPWFPAEQLGDVSWSVLVRFERRLATHFGRVRAWLAGDAAHVAAPVAVRSMNVGLREARSIADRIARALGGEPAAGLLEGYEHERLTEWRALIELEQRGLAPGASRRDRALACLPATGLELEGLRGLLGAS